MNKETLGDLSSDLRCLKITVEDVAKIQEVGKQASYPFDKEVGKNEW